MDKINTLLITNKGFLNFTYNFIENLKLINFKDKIIIACLDEESYNKLDNIEDLDFKIELILYQDEELKKFQSWGSKNYKRIVFKKLDIYFDILNRYPEKDIVYIDLDIYLFMNPIPHLIQYVKNNPKYDIYFQCDESEKVCVKCKACSGFMYIRNNDNTKKIFNWRNICSEEEAYKFTGNQQYLYKYMDKFVKWTTLSRVLYPNGVFIENIPKDALILHYNFLEGENQKMFHMIKNGHWLIDFDYKYIEDLCKFTLSPNQMSLKEYMKICEVIKEKSPCNILVYGLGNDSFLYHFINKNGYTLFIEDNKEWIEKIGEKYGYLNYEYFNFPTTVGKSLFTKFSSTISTPFINQKDWDIIIVDGPSGYDKDNPGTEIPIKESANHFKSSSKNIDVFIHDINRVLENSACNKFFENIKRENYDRTFHFTK